LKQYNNKEIIALVCTTAVAITDIAIEGALTPGAAALVSAALGYIFGREKGVT